MSQRGIVRRLFLSGLLAAGISSIAGGVSAQSVGDASKQGAAARQSVLERRMRPKPTLRGDKPGQIRVKWEWYAAVVNTYRFERTALREEMSAGVR